MSDIDLLNQVYSMAEKSANHDEIEHFIAANAAGPYETIVRAGDRGLRDRCYWLEGGTHFRCLMEYYIESPTGEMDFSHTIESGHIHVESEWLVNQEGYTEYDWKGKLVTILHGQRHYSSAGHMEAVTKAIQRGFTTDDVIDRLGKDDTPSVYLALSKEDAGNPELARGVYRNLYMESWEKYVMVEAFFDDHQYETVEENLRDLEYPENHKLHFLQSHLDSAKALGMDQHFTREQLTCMAYETLHMAGERSLLMDYVTRHNALDPATEEYKAQQPVADCCMKCLQSPKVMFQPKPPEPYPLYGLDVPRR